MKITVLNQKVFRCKKETICKILVALNINGEIDSNNYKEFEGKAVCRDDDVYDFKYGKRLALARAEIKAYKYYFNFLKQYYDDNIKIWSDMEILISKLGEQINHNSKYIKDIVSGSNE